MLFPNSRGIKAAANLCFLDLHLLGAECPSAIRNFPSRPYSLHRVEEQSSEQSQSDRNRKAFKRVITFKVLVVRGAENEYTANPAVELLHH